MTGKLISARYRVDSLIGSGGMSNVYKAYDAVEERTVALKVLKEEHREDMEFVRRFEREAKAVLMLNHENIVRSYDVGESDGISFIVLEYVEGCTLKELIQKEGALPPKTAISYTLQVLDALSHAHECGIIHRDVKPQNVIITPKGRAKLADFGIARDAAATTRTFAGASVVGTVQYISPEQARGDNVTGASDIYSCGIMLYEMLTGELPFSGDNSVAIALRHLNDDIIPPNQKNPNVPRALSDVVVKATQKDPHFRYFTARQMKNDIQRCLREPNGKFARIDKSDDSVVTRRRGSGVSNIALMLIFAIGLFTAFFFIARATRDADSPPENDYIIPKLLGKKYDEAAELAELRGFVLEVSEYRSSDSPDGEIIEQSPAAAAKAKKGDTITIVVSTGNDYVTVPDLVGKQYQDIAADFENSGLVLGTPIYMVSELPAGEIIKQEPTGDTATFAGDIVDVWVSGIPGSGLEMPAVTGIDADVAVGTLTEDGFTSIMIFPTIPDDVSMEGAVLRQSPGAGMSTSTGVTVKLWVCMTDKGQYAADIAINLDSDAPDTSVIVAAELSSVLEMVIYEGVLPVGTQQSVSFTAALTGEGEHICNVYVNDVLVRNFTKTFVKLKK